MKHFYWFQHHDNRFGTREGEMLYDNITQYTREEFIEIPSKDWNAIGYSNCVNLDTGEVMQDYAYRHYGIEIPRWTQDPLLRAMKIAEYKKEHNIQ